MKNSLMTTFYRQPDSRYSWLVLSSGFLIVWLSGGIGFSFGVVLPVFVREFNESRQNGALVGSIFIAVLLGESLISSQLCQRYSCRLMCAVGHVLCAAGYALSSIAQSLTPLFFTYSFLAGTGQSLVINSIFLAIQQYFKKRRSFAIGLLSAGVGIGTMSWGPASQIIINRISWRGFFRVVAGVSGIFAFLAFAFDPRVGTAPTKETANQGASKKETKPEQTKPPSFFQTLTDFSVWRYRPYTVAVVSVCIASLGHYAVIIHLIKYAEEIGIPATQASLLYIANGISTLFGRILGGRICDVAFVRPFYINMVAELASGIVTFCCPLATNFTQLMVVIAFYGFSDGLFRSTINILFMQTSEPNPAKVASSFGSALMATAIPTAIGPAMAGFLADQFGSYYIAFFSCGGITFFSAFIYLVEIYFSVKEKRNKARHPPIEMGLDNPTDIQDTPL